MTRCKFIWLFYWKKKKKKEKKKKKREGNIGKKWHWLLKNLVMESVCCSPHYMWTEREYTAKCFWFFLDFTHFIREIFFSFKSLHSWSLVHGAWRKEGLVVFKALQGFWPRWALILGHSGAFSSLKKSKTLK